MVRKLESGLSVPTRIVVLVIDDTAILATVLHILLVGTLHTVSIIVTDIILCCLDYRYFLLWQVKSGYLELPG